MKSNKSKNHNHFFYITPYFVFSFICFTNLFLSAQELISVESSQELIFIGKKIAYFEDIEGDLSIQDILKTNIQKKFQTNQKDFFIRRPTQSAYWFKFTVSNQTEEDIWLSLGNTTAQYLDFYAPDSLGSYPKVHETGRFRPNESKFYNILTDFWLPLNKAGEVQSKTYYFRLKQAPIMRYRLQIGSFKKLNEAKIPIDTINAIFLGWMLIMILYNAFLFLFTRDNLYLYYVGYLIAVVLTSTYISSYPIIDFLLNYQYTYFLSNYYIIWNYPAFLFTILFCTKYLDLTEHLKWVKKYLDFCKILYFLVFIPSVLGLLASPVTIFFLQLVTLTTYLICLLSAIYLFAFKKMKKAVYYVLGWSFYFIGLFIFIDRTSSFMPDTLYIQKAFLFGIAMETWMFSLALGKRLNILKEEKEKAQAENLKLIKEQNEVLEKKVQQRTEEIEHQKQELKLSNEKLLTQGEELRQNLEELITTQEFLDEKQTEVVQKTQRIETLYDNLNESIQYAKSIQEAILPTEASFEKILSESFIFFRPRDIVSGDFYFLREVEDKIILAAIDCTGHGVPGAFMSLLGNDLLEEIVVSKKILEANQILENLHLNIRHLLRQEETKNRDGMDMALVVIDRKKKILEFAGAKSPLVYIQNNHLNIIKGDKLEIGGEQREQKRTFTKHQISLKTNTTFYLFSDGYQDQFGGEKGKKFMRNHFYNLLFENHQQEMKIQKDIFIQNIENWQGDLEQVDDMLLIGVKLKP